MKKKIKKKNFWWWIILIAIILIVLYLYGNYRNKWEEENCELTFNTYTYSTDCASVCSSKCYDEGFPYTDAGFFEPYLSVEEMNNPDLYKRCECNCGGCRE